MNKRIFLIGFMGAGKTQLGKRIARGLGYSFFDSDREIEKMAGVSIQEIFQTKGEAAFRQLESDWLKNFEHPNAVISLGGGTPCFNDNITHILATGISIYIQLPPGGLISRLQQSKTIRPLIEPFKHDSPKLLVFIENKLAEREPFYLQANITISGLGIHAKMVQSLVEKLRKELEEIN